VILLYPLLLLAAIFVATSSPRTSKGSWWWLAWAAAGGLFVFSLVTGFSIGLFLLPAAAILLFWVARSAPGWREATGFLAGAATVVGFVVARNF
jgi:hypothetical protein